MSRHKWSSSEHRKPQPKTDTHDLSVAIREFEAALPGWWWLICVCSLSRDASCAPDKAGPDADLLQDGTFDGGFHCDDRNGTLASSLRDVMAQALEARAKFRARAAATGVPHDRGAGLSAQPTAAKPPPR
jgi:hypothetical protein